MASKTNIQWCDATVNFWVGCTKVSEGCKNCYMFRDQERFGYDPTVIRQTRPQNFNQALSWREPKTIFVNSWSDFFHSDADPNMREMGWSVIRQTPQHKWLLLTKRPENVDSMVPHDFFSGSYSHVWLGVTAENQEQLGKRIGIVSNSQVFARSKKFLSIEPLISRIDIGEFWPAFDQYDRVIVGGESGNLDGKYKARACKLEWIQNLASYIDRDKLFVKQLGTVLARELGMKHRHGGDMDEWSPAWGISIRNPF